MFFIYKYQFIVFFDIKNLNNSIFKLRLQIYNVNLTYIHRATCLFRTQRLIPKTIGLDKFPCVFTSDIIGYIERMSYNTFNEDFKKKFSAIALGYNIFRNKPKFNFPSCQDICSCKGRYVRINRCLYVCSEYIFYELEFYIWNV
jgi:hypothetical protein